MSAKIAQNPRIRPPLSDEHRRKLSEAQKRYVNQDDRWAEHRQKLADAQRAPDQRARLSAAQLAYMAQDPRWPQHRERMMAAALCTTRFTLLPQEIVQVIELRAKGRNFEYIAEELCLREKVIRRELRQVGIDTRPVRPERRVKQGRGRWRSFEPVDVARPEL